MSALDSLNELNKMLGTSENKEESKSERPVMSVPVAVKQAFARLVPAQQIKKIAESRIEIEAAIVSDEMLNVYSDIMFSQGCRPTNPRLLVEKDGRPDMSGLYQVQERFKLNYEKGEAPAKDRITKALCQAGFTPDIAAKIVEAEVNCQPLTVVKPLNELAVGTPVEKAAANKIIALLTGASNTQPLTSEERAAALERIEVVEVRDGILERVKSYCKNAQEVRNLFRVFVPVNFVSHCKFGESQAPEERYVRLSEEAKTLVLGSKKK